MVRAPASSPIVNPVPFPRLRWVALAFLVTWVPSYAAVWGWRNFVQLCDVAVFLTVLALWRGNALLLSSQAAGALVINALWVVDVLSRLLTGGHVIGGTEYMWKAEFPLFVRLLSLFHLVMTPLHLFCLRRIGYDRRAFRLQAAIVAAVLLASRVLALPTQDLNYVLRAPLVGRQLGPPALHLVIVFVTLLVVLVLPAHLALARWLPRSGPARGEPTAAP